MLVFVSFAEGLALCVCVCVSPSVSSCLYPVCTFRHVPRCVHQVQWSKAGSPLYAICDYCRVPSRSGAMSGMP